jgi:hypothetical protein
MLVREDASVVEDRMGTLQCLPAEVLIAIALHHLPTLTALMASSASLRAALLGQCQARRGGICLRRDEVTVGIAELVARMSLDWIELHASSSRGIADDDHDDQPCSSERGVERFALSDLAAGKLLHEDPLLAVLAGPMMRRQRVCHLKFATSAQAHGDAFELDVASLIADSARATSLCVPTRAAAYIVLAGLVGPSSAESLPAASCEPPPPLRVCLAGLGRECGVALAAAEHRSKVQFVSVADDAPSAFDLYAHSTRQPSALYPASAARTALHDCRRRYRIQGDVPPWGLAPLAPSAAFGAGGCKRRPGMRPGLSSWCLRASYEDETWRRLVACMGTLSVAAVVVGSIMHFSQHHISDSGVV